MNPIKKIQSAICLVMLFGAPIALAHFSQTARADDHPFAEAHFSLDALTAAKNAMKGEDYHASHDKLVEARKHLNLTDASEHRRTAIAEVNFAIDACEHRRPVNSIEHMDKAIAEVKLAMQ